MAMENIQVAVQVNDVTTFDADVVALKFAQHLYGADEAVAYALGKHEIDLEKALPKLGTYELLPSNGKIGVKLALFINVGHLFNFRYEAIRKFAADVLRVLADDAPSTRHLAMTIHGVGYGLDEAEALRSQLAGYLDAFDSGHFPPSLERITIVDRREDRVRRLQVALDRAIPGNIVPLPASKGALRGLAVERSPMTKNVGRESASKPHAFVAMPFAEEMDDVYYYGIQAPVNAAGYLCERLDLTPFVGDVLERIRERIETASFVIAEVTTANPNVFLEIGYAWGRDRPTILLSRDAEKLPFDVQGQRCLVYKRIRDLEKALTKELEGLKGDII
jgi:hypothetical protein